MGRCMSISMMSVFWSMEIYAPYIYMGCASKRKNILSENARKP